MNRRIVLKLGGDGMGSVSVRGQKAKRQRAEQETFAASITALNLHLACCFQVLTALCSGQEFHHSVKGVSVITIVFFFLGTYY